MHGRGAKVILLAAMLLVAVGTMVGTARADTYVPGDWSPSVWSDQQDYRPGDQVTLSGANWQPGESVHIVVNDDEGQSWSREADVTAAEDGSISDTFALPNWFVAVYSVKATGASGAVATTTFTDGTLAFALATVDNAAPSGTTWTVNWEQHKKSATCQATGSDLATGTVTYTGATKTGSEPSIGNQDSGRPTSAQASGYRLTYWSSSATSTTPLTNAQLCQNNNQGTTFLYAHFETAIQTTSLAAADATGTYGGTTTLSATLTAGGSGVAGKTITFKANGTTVGTATTNATGVATLSNASLAGIDAGTYNTGINASFAGDSGFTSASANSKLTVGQKTVTGSFTANGKVYDGSDAATIATRGLAGVINGDAVTLSGGTATFSDAKAAAGKTVNGTGFTLAGAKAGNYALASSSLTTTASITRKPLTGAFTANNKVYDRTTAATVATTQLPGVVGTDNVTLKVTGAAFGTATVGTDKTVTADLALEGGDAGNYSLTAATATAKANITAAPVTGSFTADNKVYDGNRSATVKSQDLAGVIGLDKVTLHVTGATFADRNVGQDKTVTADLAIDGDDAGNYALTSATATTKANITAAPVTGSFTAENKVYDRTADATVDTKTLTGAVEDDDVTLVVSGAHFEDRFVGDDKKVTGALSLDGDDAGNYALDATTAETKANITKASVTGSFTAENKVYDGNRDATVKTQDLAGVIGEDDVTLHVTGATFDDRNVGQDKTVTADLAIDGDDAGNYELTSGVATANADIAAKSVSGAFTAQNKVYDRTADATVDTKTLTGAVEDDDVTLVVTGAHFEDRFVGDGKKVTGALSLDGDDAGNYALDAPTAETKANITKASVTGSFTAENKVYDGNRDATVKTQHLDGVIGEDDVSLKVTGAQFDDRQVGEGKTVTADLALEGDDAGNYALTSASATTEANITAKELTGSFTANDKVYDRNADATVKTSSLPGTIDGDDIALEVTNLHFDDRHVGQDKTVTADLALSGDDAPNYLLTAATATTQADITARVVTGSFTAAGKDYDGTDAATILTRAVDGIIDGDHVELSGGSATFGGPRAGADKTVTGTGFALTGDDADEYSLESSTLETTATIAPKQLTGSFTANDKVYDGTRDATVKSKDLPGIIGPDKVVLEVTNVLFENRNVGQDKTVTADLALDGDDAGNYSLTSATASTSASITSATVTGSFTADDKVYDGDRSATVKSQNLAGVIGLDEVTLHVTGATFDDRNVGQDKTVTADLAIDGDDAGNYVLASTSATTKASITAKELTGSFTANDKVYDGMRDATVKTKDLPGIIGPDKVVLEVTNVLFEDRNVGPDKTVTADLAITGDDAGNYELSSATATTKASITRATVTGSFTADDKVYDGNRDATVKTQNLAGVIGLDEVTLHVTGAAFDDRTVGADKTVTADLAIDGDDAGNYVLASTSATTKASITAKELTGSFTANDKVYDRNADATVKTKDLPGIIGPDKVALVLGNVRFDDRHVGEDKTVTADLTLDGDDAGNYKLTSATATTKASITARTVTGSFTAADKVYDGTDAATIVTRDVHGVIDGDTVQLTDGSAMFGGPAAGQGKTVTGHGFEITGDDANEYALESSTLTTIATIKPKELTGSFTAADKVYDGDDTATVSGKQLPGVVGTDDVTLKVSGAKFADRNVGQDKTVTANLALEGTAAGNYALSGVTATAKASITRKPVTGSFTAADKVYDGTRAATVASRQLDGAVSGDKVTLQITAQFGDRNAGADKTVTGALSLAGDDAGNYALTSATATTKAAITAKPVSGAFTAADKLYDTTVAATITGRSVTGVIAPDDVTLTGGTATLSDAGVGSGKTVTGTGFALGGTDKGNYALASSTLTTTASISYRWDGFLQPINDTAHTGEFESKFKLGSTIPVKFQIKNAAGVSLQQAVLPGFDRTGYRGVCDSATTTEPNADLPLSTGTTYRWDSGQYIYNFSSKGITQAGEYRIYAKLADGTTRYVDLCLTK